MHGQKCGVGDEWVESCLARCSFDSWKIDSFYEMPMLFLIGMTLLPGPQNKIIRLPSLKIRKLPLECTSANSSNRPV